MTAIILNEDAGSGCEEFTVLPAFLAIVKTCKNIVY